MPLNPSERIVYRIQRKSDGYWYGDSKLSRGAWGDPEAHWHPHVGKIYTRKALMCTLGTGKLKNLERWKDVMVVSYILTDFGSVDVSDFVENEERLAGGGEDRA